MGAIVRDHPTETRPASPSARIAGWLPSTMLDWPGRLATTVFLSGCGYRCAFCHNASLLETKDDRDTWPDLAGYLNTHRAWIDGVVVTGGEPTDDPDILDLLEAFASLDVPVKLDTNGCRPDVLRELLDQELASYVAMDVKTTSRRYPEVTHCPDSAERASESIRAILDSGVDHEFRTTAYPGAVGLNDLPGIASTLNGAQRYVIQQFRPDETLDPAAAQTAPYEDEQLHAAARSCRSFVPTSVRGTTGTRPEAA